MRLKSELRKEQIFCIDFAKEKRKCALFLSMGAGKTAIGLTVASDLLEDFSVSRVLILAPLRVANTVWHTEASEWAHLCHLKFAVATGSVSKRESALEDMAEISVMNFENLPWLVEHYGNKWPFDMVIVDESSKLKSHSTNRFKSLRRVLPLVSHVILASGTPAPEGVADLWSQIYLLDRGERLGRTVSNFRSRFFRQIVYGGFAKYVPNEGASDKVQELISDIAMTLYVDTEFGSVDLVNYTDIPTKAKKLMADLKRDLVVQLENGTEVATESAAAVGNKMLQICSGAMYDESGKYHLIHDKKLKDLREIVDDNPNENFLVAYGFRSDKERLLKAFPEAVLLTSSGDEIDAWNKGKIKILLVHPASGGHGLNIQHGGSFLVWFTMTWSLELYQQFCKRLDRPGQKSQVRNMHMLSKGTIEERIYEAIANKAATQKDITDYLLANI